VYALRGDPRHADLAVRILAEFADRYDQWPNRDNVLGPTRPFFSTYLESIWLLNLCHALDLLDASLAPGADRVGAQLRDRLIAPSASLIASYHEGTSNRQVWNDVAVLSAFRVLHDQRAFERRLEADQQLLTLLDQGLLADGTWYEGENYHLFAHRGLWYGMQLLAAAELTLPAPLGERYASGFVTPFLGMLPDETIPSRRDSQYAVSIRQWRFAEWCELGYAYRADPRLAGVLSRLYDGSITRHSTARARSTADAERNEAPSSLSRADLSWRSVLMASAQPVPPASWAPESALLPLQGLAVLRREQGRAYVALEGGHSGSGHGHPDRLALSLQTGRERWLQDPGTGSYVERTLHWYRSTVAHHAPLVNGASQPPAMATLLAFEDRGGMGWVRKRATIGPGIRATRTVVAAECYCVDVLDWERDVDESAAAPHAITITLPICGDARRSVGLQAHLAPGVRRARGRIRLSARRRVGHDRGYRGDRRAGCLRRRHDWASCERATPARRERAGHAGARPRARCAWLRRDGAACRGTARLGRPTRVGLALAARRHAAAGGTRRAGRHRRRRARCTHYDGRRHDGGAWSRAARLAYRTPRAPRAQ
jgi:hypothetical protein